jgi:small GTP-binding protein
MNLAISINNFSETSIKSPLREAYQKNIMLPFDYRQELGQIKQYTEILQEKFHSTLNVALIGEVKAGKSTLINALVGEAISPTNVLEATAHIFEIGYSKNPSIEVLYENQDIKAIEKSQINETLSSEDHQVSKITIKTNNHSFKELYLIDTPGLATITQKNADVTKRFLQKADVVLWIFNSAHLGQTDITEEISQVANMGKPIIGILNKIDEVDDDPERLVKYLNRKLGQYLESVFFLSARMAFDGVTSNDAKKVKKSNIEELILHLRENIDKKSDVVKTDSIKSSFKSILENETLIHKSSNDIIKNAIDIYNKIIPELNYEKDKIRKDTEHQINNEINKHTETIRNDLKYENKTHLSQKLLEISTTISHEIQTGIYSEKINSVIEKISSEYQVKFEKKLMEEKSTVASILSEVQHETLDSKQEVLKQSTKNGAIVGSSVGTGAVVWGAAIGKVTLLAGLTATILPFALIGGFAGLAIGYINNQKRADALEKAERQITHAMKETIFLAFKEKIDNDFNKIITSYQESYNIKNLEKLKTDNTQYIAKVNSHIFI